MNEIEDGGGYVRGGGKSYDRPVDGVGRAVAVARWC